MIFNNLLDRITIVGLSIDHLKRKFHSPLTIKNVLTSSWDIITIVESLWVIFNVV